VPSFPSFLDRFRRLLAPPGRPGEALGVPAAGDDLHGELEPLFEQLDTVDAQAQEIERDAIAQAQERHAHAQAQADAILEQARRRAEEERARAALEQRAEVQRRTVEMHEAARREAERIGAVREDRVTELVSEVLECVRRSGR
jgi:flagellar biosynthesis/type III secretory pathway protein FliH